VKRILFTCVKALFTFYLLVAFGQVPDLAKYAGNFYNVVLFTSVCGLFLACVSFRGDDLARIKAEPPAPRVWYWLYRAFELVNINLVVWFGSWLLLCVLGLTYLLRGILRKLASDARKDAAADEAFADILRRNSAQGFPADSGL
jgi:hypothetical protein